MAIRSKLVCDVLLPSLSWSSAARRSVRVFQRLKQRGPTHWTTLKGLGSSPSLTLPHSSSSLQQHQQQTPSSSGTSEPPPQSLETARPYSDIPKINALRLRMKLVRDSSNSANDLRVAVDELGSVFNLSMPGFPPIVCVVDPKDIETVFRAGDNDHPERMQVVEWIRSRRETNSPLGLVMSDGEDWYRQRKPVSKFILMPRKMAEYHVPFNQVVLDYIKLIRRERQGDDVFMDLTASLNKWSLESVSLFVLGRRMGCLGDEMPPECKQFVDNIHTFLQLTAEFMFGLPFHRVWRTRKWKRFIKCSQDIRNYTNNIVGQKIQEIEREDVASGEEVRAELGTDFLTYMVHTGDMSVGEIAVNAIDLLNAGVDTTSLTMSGCLYSLATNPDVQERLREEVRGVLGEEELVTPQHIQDMHYLRDTIKETMRLFPIAPNNSRILKEDVVLSGYKVPAGTSIMMSTITSGRLAEYFPEPDKFKPERWSRDSAELPNSFSSLPFGFGRRMCIGRRVAELEMHILLAQLLRNFKMEFREEEPVKFVTKLFYGPGRPVNLAFVDYK